MTHTTPLRWRRLLPATFIAATAIIGGSAFAGIAVANADYKDSDFASCMNRDMPTDYCCEHAGGVMRNGACIDPETLKVPSSGVLQQDPQTPPTKVRTFEVVDLPTFTMAR
ncbi:MAG: hypothetical protein JST91_21640 [Actinobacteria bacterium]|nr:hypothetical protein [Actinomycetota bacterium]